MGNLFNISAVFEQMPYLLEHLGVTLFLTLFSFLIGMIFAGVLAFIRIKELPVINQLAQLYVSFIRGTPILIQLYISFFGLPILMRLLNARFGWNINFEAVPNSYYAIAALGFNQAAFLSETFRSAFLSVDKGQIEAAYTIGMNQQQALTRIIIPEAFTTALPNVGNSLISLLKGTSLAFSSGVVEITAAAKLIGGRTYRYIEAYVAVALIYWAITIILELVFRYLEKKATVPDQIESAEVELEYDKN